MRKVEITVYKANELNKFALMKAYAKHLNYLLQFTAKEEDVYISVEQFIEVSNNDGEEYLEDGSLFYQ